MPKKIYKAMISGSDNAYNACVKINGKWKDFFTPFDVEHDNYSEYTKASNAKRGAIRIAAELGITLDWEE